MVCLCWFIQLVFLGTENTLNSSNMDSQPQDDTRFSENSSEETLTGDEQTENDYLITHREMTELEIHYHKVLYWISSMDDFGISTTPHQSYARATFYLRNEGEFIMCTTDCNNYIHDIYNSVIRDYHSKKKILTNEE